MPRFFVPKEDISQEKIILKDENNFHISRTLRMRKGEEIVVSDMCSKEYLCVLEEFSKDCCIAKIIKIQSYKSESEQKITLFQCLPKSDKMEQIIKKSTELGVFQIYPVLSKRCISRPDEKSMLKKNERYEKIALEAAKQSQRGIIPQVNNLIDFNSMLSMLKTFDRTIIYYENGGDRTKNILSKNDKNIAIIIGAEGGFEEQEVDKAKQNSAFLATLGTRILRCETAPIVALTVINSFFEEL